MSHFAFLYEDEQAKAIDYMVRAEHPSFGGSYWRYAPLLRFSVTPGLARPYCEQGEYTRAILDELGFSEAEMADLREAKVVAWPVDESEPVSASA
jgi:crotonobetainyl-CoA:carnitine CoA-transferase CaiB-like acyl-CoA transferase